MLNQDSRLPRPKTAVKWATDRKLSLKRENKLRWHRVSAQNKTPISTNYGGRLLWRIPVFGKHLEREGKGLTVPRSKQKRLDVGCNVRPKIGGAVPGMSPEIAAVGVAEPPEARLTARSSLSCLLFPVQL
jgi:hypothetical protein